MVYYMSPLPSTASHFRDFSSARAHSPRTRVQNNETPLFRGYKYGKNQRGNSSGLFSMNHGANSQITS